MLASSSRWSPPVGSRDPADIRHIEGRPHGLAAGLDLRQAGIDVGNGAIGEPIGWDALELRLVRVEATADRLAAMQIPSVPSVIGQVSKAQPRVAPSTLRAASG